MATTEYIIEELSYSGDYRPEGDGYAPQIVFTRSMHGWNTYELNTESLPVDAEFILELFDNKFPVINYKGRYRDTEFCADVLVRWFRIMFDIEVRWTITRGYSQGDWGISFIFGTPEFYKVTGAPGLTDTDHNDLCAWLWGDVYEVRTKEVTQSETCNLGHDHVTILEESELDHIIYGMDEAHKFAKEHNIEIEGL